MRLFHILKGYHEGDTIPYSTLWELKTGLLLNEVLSYKGGYMPKSIKTDGSFIDRAVMNKFCKKIMIVLSNKQDYQTQNYTELVMLRHAALTSDAMDGVLNELLDLSESKFLKEFPL